MGLLDAPVIPKDKRGARLGESAMIPIGDSHRAASMFATVTVSANLSLSSGNGNPTPIAWDYRRADTSGIWSSSANQRLTIPPGGGGYWKGRAQLQFPGSATGVREVIINRIFDPSNPTQKSVVARVSVQGVARNQPVMAEFPALPCLEGQWFEVQYYQDSGTTMTILPGQLCYFTIERVGDLRGSWDGAGFSADFAYQSGWSKYDQIIEESGTSIVPDPLNPERMVGMITATHENNSVIYPRVQARTAANLDIDGTGAPVYIGLSIMVPQETYDHLLAVRAANDPGGPGYNFGFNIHEIYGPPSGTMSPNRFRFDPVGGITLNKYTGPVGAGSVVQLWNLPPAECVGKWIDLIHVVKLSSDPSVGYHELYVNKGDGNGRVMQNLNDGVAAPGTRVYLATVLAGVNDGGKNYASLKNSFGNESPIVQTKLYIAGHRVGTSILVAGEASTYQAKR